MTGNTFTDTERNFPDKRQSLHEQRTIVFADRNILPLDSQQMFLIAISLLLPGRNKEER